MCTFMWGERKREREKEVKESLRFISIKWNQVEKLQSNIKLLLLCSHLLIIISHTLKIYLLFFWLKSWAFNWVVICCYMCLYPHILNFSFRCCAARNFFSDDERTISNDNFFFGFYTLCALIIITISPWRSIDHMISFSLIILGIYIKKKYFFFSLLPAAILWAYNYFFFCESRRGISTRSEREVSRGNSNHLAFCWWIFLIK